MTTCDGSNRNRDCTNEATWKAKGWATRFGVKLTSHHCDSCKIDIGDESEPKIYGGVSKIVWEKL